MADDPGKAVEYPIKDNGVLRRVLHRDTGEVATAAESSLKADLAAKGEEFDDEVFKTALNKVSSMGANNLKDKKTKDALVGFLKSKYNEKKTERTTGKQAKSVVEPPRFADVVDDSKNIFNVIRESSLSDNPSQISALLLDKTYNKESAFNSTRVVLVPSTYNIVGNVRTKSECEVLKEELGKLSIADKTKITDAEIAALTAKNSKYTKAFVEKCLLTKPLFDGYGLQNPTPPPPTKSGCEVLKEELDKLSIADKTKITDAEIAALNNPKYTKAFVENCLLTKPLFDGYGLQNPTPPPPTKSGCEVLKEELDKLSIADKSKITRAEIAALNNPKYTDDFVVNCLATKPLFDGYGLDIKDFPPPPSGSSGSPPPPSGSAPSTLLSTDWVDYLSASVAKLNGFKDRLSKVTPTTSENTHYKNIVLADIGTLTSELDGFSKMSSPPSDVPGTKTRIDGRLDQIEKDIQNLEAGTPAPAGRISSPGGLVGITSPASPPGAPFDLSNFSGRVNLQGNLTISGTLDIHSGNLQITGIAPFAPAATPPPAAETNTCAILGGYLREFESVPENDYVYGKDQICALDVIHLYNLNKDKPAFTWDDIARCTVLMSGYYMNTDRCKEIKAFLDDFSNYVYGKNKVCTIDLITLYYTYRQQYEHLFPSGVPPYRSTPDEVRKCFENQTLFPPSEYGFCSECEDIKAFLDAVAEEEGSSFDKKKITPDVVKRLLDPEKHTAIHVKGFTFENIQACIRTGALDPNEYNTDPPVDSGSPPPAGPTTPPPVVPPPPPPSPTIGAFSSAESISNEITQFINKTTKNIQNQDPSLTYDSPDELRTKVQEIIDKLNHESYDLVKPAESPKYSKESVSATYDVADKPSKPYGVIRINLNRDDGKVNIWKATVGKAEVVQMGGKQTTKKNYTFYILPRGQQKAASSPPAVPPPAAPVVTPPPAAPVVTPPPAAPVVTPPPAAPVPTPPPAAPVPTPPPATSSACCGEERPPAAPTPPPAAPTTPPPAAPVPTPPPAAPVVTPPPAAPTTPPPAAPVVTPPPAAPTTPPPAAPTTPPPAASTPKRETIKIDGKELGVGDTVYLKTRLLTDKRTCLQKVGDKATINKINKLFGFQTGSVKINCTNGTSTDDYYVSELSADPPPRETTAPAYLPGRGTVLPPKVDPTLRQCKDSTGADIAPGDLVRGVDFPEGKKVKEIHQMTQGVCYVQLEDDKIIGSLLLTKESVPQVESDTSAEYKRRLELESSQSLGKEIPLTCLSSMKTTLTVGQYAKAPSSAGPITVKILQHLPRVRNMGPLSDCDILVETVFEPVRRFLVTSWWLEPANPTDIRLAQLEILNRSKPPTSTPPPPTASLPLEPVSTPGFFEAQEGAGCGRHALNNLIGGLNFTKGDKNVVYDLNNPVKPVPLQSVCALLRTQDSTLECLDSEDYDINVLRAGLNLYGYPVEQATAVAWRQDRDDFGYVVNFGGGHWVALRKTSTNKLLYINSIGGSNAGIPYDSIPAFLTDMQQIQKRRIPGILVVRKRKSTTRIDPLETLRNVKLSEIQEVATVDAVTNKKIELINVFNGIIGQKLDDQSLEAYAGALLANNEGIADMDAFIGQFINNQSDKDIDRYVENLKQNKADLEYLANVIWKPSSALSPAEKTAKTVKLAGKLGINTIREILLGGEAYESLTDDQKKAVRIRGGRTLRNRISRNTTRRYGGGDPPKGPKGPKPTQQSSDSQKIDLIDYNRAFAAIKSTTFSLPELKARIDTIIKLKKDPGEEIKQNDVTPTELKKISEKRKDLDKKETEKENLESELENLKNEEQTLTEEIPVKQNEVNMASVKDKPKAEGELNTLKKDLRTTQTSIRQKERDIQKTINKINELKDSMTKLSAVVYEVIDTKKKVFGSADEILTSAKFKELSVVPPYVMDIFIRKLEVIRDTLDNQSGISQVEIDDITSELTSTKKSVENTVPFEVTPLQYAVLAGNREIVEQLIYFGAPITETITFTKPSKNGDRYSLTALAEKRLPADPNKQGVLDLTKEITKARSDAAIAVQNNAPKDENYGKDPKSGKVDTIKNLVYKKIYTELREGKPEITIDEARFAKEIAMGKADAEAGTPKQDLYKPIEWKVQSTALEAAKVAYTRSYEITRAAMDGKRDGATANPVQNPEYDKEEYNSSPLRAIKAAYIEEFNKAKAVDYDRGYLHGLKAAPFSPDVSSYPFMETRFVNMFLETGRPETKQNYRRGYNQGLNQVLTPNVQPGMTSAEPGYYDTIMASAKAAGEFDGSEDKPRYTTPAKYNAVDTRGKTVLTAEDLKKKTIPIDMKLNNLITDIAQQLFDQTPTPNDLAEANRRQKLIKDLTDAYDAEFNKAQVARSRSAGIPKAAAPGLPPSSAGKRKTKKMSKKSPKRRTLRRK